MHICLYQCVSIVAVAMVKIYLLFSKYCLVLVGFRNGFEGDLHQLTMLVSQSN